RSQLGEGFGDAVIISSGATMCYSGHPHFDLEFPGEFPQGLHVLQHCAIEVKAFENQTSRIEVGIFPQEVDRMAQLGDGERLACISVDYSVALHLEPGSG